MIDTTYNAGASPAATTPAVSSADTPKKTDPAGKEMFMQLLVAQIKNQNPLNPTDGIQFLSQLAQFTELEQLTGMRADLAAVRTHMETPPPAASTPETQGGV